MFCQFLIISEEQGNLFLCGIYRAYKINLPENPYWDFIMNDPLEQGKHVDISVCLTIVQDTANEI